MDQEDGRPSKGNTPKIKAAAALAPAPPQPATPSLPDKGSDDPKKDLKMEYEGEDADSRRKARNRAKRLLQKEQKARKEEEPLRELNDLRRYKADKKKSLTQ